MARKALKPKKKAATKRSKVGVRFRRISAQPLGLPGLNTSIVIGHAGDGLAAFCVSGLSPDILQKGAHLRIVNKGKIVEIWKSVTK